MPQPAAWFPSAGTSTHDTDAGTACPASPLVGHIAN
jgi:hypothetical protein